MEKRDNSLEDLNTLRKNLKQNIQVKLIPSLYTRSDVHTFRKHLSAKHNDKLFRLSKEQEKPLFNIKNTVICHGLEKMPPKYVLRDSIGWSEKFYCGRFQPE